MEWIFIIAVLAVALATIFFVMAEPGMKKATTLEPHDAHAHGTPAAGHAPAPVAAVAAAPVAADRPVEQAVAAEPVPRRAIPVEADAAAPVPVAVSAPVAEAAEPLVEPLVEPVVELPGAALGDLEHASSVGERVGLGDGAHGAGEGSRVAAEPVPYVSSDYDPGAGRGEVEAAESAPVVEPVVELPGAALGDLEHASSVEERVGLGDGAHGAGEGSRVAAEPVPYVSSDYDPDLEVRLAAATAGLAGLAGVSSSVSGSAVVEEELPADVVTEPEPVAEMVAEGGAASVVAPPEVELPGAALGDLEHASSVGERVGLGDGAHGAGEGSRVAAEPVPYVSSDYDPDLEVRLAAATAGLAGLAGVSSSVSGSAVVEEELPADVVTEPEPVAEMVAEGGAASVVAPPVVESVVELPGAALGDLEHASSVGERVGLGDGAHGAGEGSRVAAEPVPYVSSDYDPDLEVRLAAATAGLAGLAGVSSSVSGSAVVEEELPADVVTEPEPVAEMVAEGGAASVAAPAAIEPAAGPEELPAVPESPELLSGPERVEIPATVIPAAQYEGEPEPLERPAPPEPAEVPEQPESVADYLASIEGEEEVEQVWDGPFGPGSAEAGSNGEGPRGWTVKAARQTKVYLTPDIAVYEAARANVWFVDEQRAIDAGFRRWDMPSK